ncbi:unnamed protein product [Closterium sp. Naga37s-1]|nr:unnamed protein product [Closterium sp. Naga37s-1]
MEWLTSAEGLNARQELEASVREHHPNLCDEEIDLIVDGRLLRMVRECAAEQPSGGAQQGAEHEAPGAVGIDGGAVVPTIDMGMIGTSYGQYKFGVEHIFVTPLLEGMHDLTAKEKGEGSRRTRRMMASGRRSKGRCYNCNEEGHMAAKCPNKKKNATPAAAVNVAEGDGKGVALTVACSAAKLLAVDNDLRFLDSGCSQHMTGRKEWFTMIDDPSATKSVKGFDGSMQEVAGIGEVLLEGTNGLRVTLHDVLFVLGMKANCVSPGQLTDKGANLQNEEGVTRIIASRGQAAATARYRHRLLYLDLKPWPASNGTMAGAACNDTVSAAACTGTTAGAACNGTVVAAACNGTAAAATCNSTVAAVACIDTVAAAAAVTCNGITKAAAEVVPSEPEENDEAASLTTYAVEIEAMLNLQHTHLENDYAGAVKWTATNGGVLVMDLEKGGEDTSSASSQEAKLTRQTLPLPDEREGEVLRMVHGPEQNQPLSRSIIMVPVPSVQEGEQLFDRSVGPLSSKAPTTPPPLGLPSVADSALVGLEDGPLEVGTSMADHEDEEEEVAVDEQSPMAHEHEPSPAVSPIQPIPPPPRRSSRPNTGVPLVRFQPLSMTAQDADDKDNPYDVAYLTEDDCDTDSDDEVEYPDEDEEEEGAWGGVILDLAAALTGHEGKE